MVIDPSLQRQLLGGEVAACHDPQRQAEQVLRVMPNIAQLALYKDIANDIWAAGHWVVGETRDFTSISLGEDTSEWGYYKQYGRYPYAVKNSSHTRGYVLSHTGKLFRVTSHELNGNRQGIADLSPEQIAAVTPVVPEQFGNLASARELTSGVADFVVKNKLQFAVQYPEHSLMLR